jgi:hypothetical protein
VAEYKKVTPQTIIGEEGVNLIVRRVLEMGHLFHPRRIDHGIDGHIDLVEPGTGRHLNQTILVQSKAHDRSLQQESRTSFVFTCDQRDLEHWLAGNAPGIVVVSHPPETLLTRHCPKTGPNTVDTAASAVPTVRR